MEAEIKPKIDEDLRLVDEAHEALKAAAGRDPRSRYSALIVAERAIPRLADALGYLARLSPNTAGAMECTGLGFGLDAKYHIAWGINKTLADQVLAYAKEHYEEAGWDVLIESVPKAAVRLVLCDLPLDTTLEQGLKLIDKQFGLSIYNEKREDIRAAGDCDQ